MSKRNSRQAKQLRREKNAWKETRYVPCPRPDEYISHIGFVPNDSYFYNSALASIINEQQFAFRTKNQIVDFVKTQDFLTRDIFTKTGKGFIELSCYYLIDEKASKNCYSPDSSMFSKRDQSKFRKQQNIADGAYVGGSFSISETKKGNPTALYMVRHRYIDEKFVKDKKDYQAKNPMFTRFNTIWVGLDEVENLPTGLFSDDEIIYWASRDEALQPMDEEELDRLLSMANESCLKDKYETNEDGDVIIDEFQGFDGQVYYQPKKKRETWLNCFSPLPLQVTGTQLRIAGAPERHNILTGQEVV